MPQTAVQSYLDEIARLEMKLEKNDDMARALEIEDEIINWQRKIYDLLREDGGVECERAAHQDMLRVKKNTGKNKLQKIKDAVFGKDAT